MYFSRLSLCKRFTCYDSLFYCIHSILISHTIVEIANGIFWKGSNQPPSGVLTMPPPLLQHYVICCTANSTGAYHVLYRVLILYFFVIIMITGSSIVMDTTTVLIMPNPSCLCEEVLQETASYMYLTAYPGC